MTNYPENPIPNPLDKPPLQTYREIDALNDLETWLIAKPCLVTGTYEVTFDLLQCELFETHGADIKACEDEIAEMVKEAQARLKEASS